MILEELKHPFPPADIEWRVQQSGEKNGKPWAMVLAYVTNRAIMDRLDAVCGPENWENAFTTGPGGGILCGLTIHLDGRSVTKWDGAENTDIEAVKGGLSNAMKRAAVQWGIGRYLYNLDAGFADVCGNGKHWVKANKQKNIPSFKWNPPRLPQWALPAGTTQQAPAPTQTPPAARQGPPAGSSRLISEKQAKFLYVLCGKKSSDPDGTRKAILEKTGVKKFEELPYDTGKKLIGDMAGRPDIEGGYGGPSDKDAPEPEGLPY